MRWLSLLTLLLVVGCSSTSKIEPERAEISSPTAAIDPQTQARVDEWQALIKAGREWSDMRRLVAVNDFINRFQFVDDIHHWKQEDYWATPLQTLVTQGGDCEDFSIAKYFTLTAMGMEQERLRLTYVKALNLNQAHMVVSYFEAPDMEPLVLDNLDPQIKPASHRQDLLPVYSFNGSGLWLAKRDSSSQYVDDASRIGMWRQLMQTLDVEAANQQQMICLYQHYDLPAVEAQTRCN